VKYRIIDIYEQALLNIVKVNEKNRFRSDKRSNDIMEEIAIKALEEVEKLKEKA